MKKRLTLLLAVFGVCLSLPAMATGFTVSQIGYHSQGPKWAILDDVPETVKLKVIVFDPAYKDKWEIFNGRKVFEVKNITALPDTDQEGPSTKRYKIDFSEFKTPGKYELRLEGLKDYNVPIEVSDYTYWDLLTPVIKTFYFQRNGQRLTDRSINFDYYDCYGDDSLPVKNNQRVHIDAGGGWYNDDGFNKSVLVNSLASSRLLALYQLNPKAFQYFRMNYPFDQDGLGSVPDIVLEMKTGLEWLMTMQRRDGAFYGGVSGEPLTCDAVSDADSVNRFVEDATAKDTAAATAALATAGYALKQKDLGYAVRSLRSAEKGWDYLSKIPVTKGDLPYRLWAAAELYIGTGQLKYHQFFAQNYKMVPFSSFTPQNPLFQGEIDYLLYAPTKNKTVENDLRRKITAEADRIFTQVDQRPLQGGLEQVDGNTDKVVEYGDMLLAAYRLTNNENYRKAATETVFYIFGLNPVGKTYVTGIGNEAVKNMFHQRFADSQRDLPGYLIETSTKPNAKLHTSILNNADLAYVLTALNASYNQVNPNAPKKEETGQDILDKLQPKK